MVGIKLKSLEKCSGLLRAEELCREYRFRDAAIPPNSYDKLSSVSRI